MTIATRTIIDRPRLTAELDRALTHRLTLLVADAGFGKSTLLSSWTAGINAVVHEVTVDDATLAQFAGHVVDTLRLRVPDLSRQLGSVVRGAPGPDAGGDERARPEAIAELLGHMLQELLVRDLALVIDNAELVGDGPSARLLAGLVRHAPPLLHVVLAARETPDIALGRLRDGGQVLEFHGADLAFTVDEVAAVLDATVRSTDQGLAEAVHEVTGGWPVAVRLTVEALRDVAPRERWERIGALTTVEGRLGDLFGEVLEREPPAAKRLLAVAALFDNVTVDLLEDLGQDDAGELVDRLVRRGLFLEPSPGADAGYRMNAIARVFVAQHASLPADDAAELQRRAADRFLARGRPRAALRALIGSGHHEAVADLLLRVGERLATTGHADAVVAAFASLPEEARTLPVERLAGLAFQLRGDWDQALRHFERVAGEQDRLDPGLAWRMGLIHHLRGELDTALAVYGRADLGDVASADSALLLAWSAAAHWLRADAKASGEFAARALNQASVVGDPAALAAAHTALAMVAALEGDRRANDAHYVKALEYADRADDVLQLIRIHTNRASHHAEEAAYPEALAELDVAIRLADLSGYAAFGALALSNRAEVRLRQGRLEEAMSDADASIAAFEELRSALVAYPLTLLGELHRLRGNSVSARTSYERAIAAAGEAGDRQGEVPALAGLALTLGDEDPERAEHLARRAVDAGHGMGYVHAQLAAARLAAQRGERERVLTSARAARETAESRRDRAGTAEALEIEAGAIDEDDEALALADRAVELWDQIGDPIGRARAELVKAARLDRPAARALADDVRARMRAIGCRLIASWAHSALTELAPGTVRSVRVETLGGLRVLRNGSPVRAAAWTHPEARDLLMVLVARRGRPVTRDEFGELLWPDRDPGRVAQLVDDAVAALTRILDPQGEAESPPVSADGDTVRLDLDRLDLDLTAFLEDAEAGIRLLHGGRDEDAVERLVRAASLYGGDFLEGDVEAEWARSVRNEARATYVLVAASLADHASERGDPDTAVRYLLRILAHDPYDEGTHLRLVIALTAAGRHGDARRHYRTYCERMGELDVEPAPFPKPPTAAG